MKKREWNSEQDAGRVITAFLGGTAVQVDRGGGAEQLHDIDIVLPGEMTIAVEVTRHNIESHLATLAAADARGWRFGALSFDWQVSMTPAFNVQALHREIAPLLSTFERAGVATLLLQPSLFDSTLLDADLEDDEHADRAMLRDTETYDAALRLYDLGARLIYRFLDAAPGGGEVIVSEASRAGSSSPAVVIELVEVHANRADNVKKLEGAADRHERHLFIWVEHSQMPAVTAFNFSKVLPGTAGLPDRAPNLPEGVDAVWAATAYDSSHVWQYHRIHGWRDLGTWDRETNQITRTGRQ